MNLSHSNLKELIIIYLDFYKNYRGSVYPPSTNSMLLPNRQDNGFFQAFNILLSTEEYNNIYDDFINAISELLNEKYITYHDEVFSTEGTKYYMLTEKGKTYSKNLPSVAFYKEKYGVSKR